MPKPNAYLMKLQAQKQAEMSLQRQFTIQWCADAAVLAANEVFHRKGPTLVEFYNVFVRWAHEIAEMAITDAKDDKDMAFTKGKLDAMLEKLLEDDFIPYEERYAPTNLLKKKGTET